MMNLRRVEWLVRKAKVLNRLNSNDEYKLVFDTKTGIPYIHHTPEDQKEEYYFIQYMPDEFINALRRKFIRKSNIVIHGRGLGYVTITINKHKYQMGINWNGYQLWSLYGYCNRIDFLGCASSEDYKGKVLNSDRIYYGRWGKFIAIGNTGLAASVIAHRPPERIKNIPTDIVYPQCDVCVLENAEISESKHLVVTVPVMTLRKECSEYIELMYIESLRFEKLVFRKGTDRPIELFDAENQSIGYFTIIIMGFDYHLFNITTGTSTLIRIYRPFHFYYNMYGELRQCVSDGNYRDEYGNPYNGKIIYVDACNNIMCKRESSSYVAWFVRLYMGTNGQKTKPALHNS
jgi:hypothetical protein